MGAAGRVGFKGYVHKDGTACRQGKRTLVRSLSLQTAQTYVRRSKPIRHYRRDMTPESSPRRARIFFPKKRLVMECCEEGTFVTYKTADIRLEVTKVPFMLNTVRTRSFGRRRLCFTGTNG